MKPTTLLLSAFALLCLSVPGNAQTAVVPRAASTDFETGVEFAGIGKSGIAAGSQALGDLSSRQVRANLIRTFSVDESSSWSLGGGWEHFEFDAPAGTPIPERLSSLTLKLGYNRQLTSAWSLRAEVDPGFYSDFQDLDRGDFNAPAGLRLVYAASCSGSPA